MTLFVIGTTRYWAQSPKGEIEAWWIEKRYVHSGSIDWDFSGFQPQLTRGTRFATREEAESHAVQIATRYPRYIGKLYVDEVPWVIEESKP